MIDKDNLILSYEIKEDKIIINKLAQNKKNIVEYSKQTEDILKTVMKNQIIDAKNYLKNNDEEKECLQTIKFFFHTIIIVSSVFAFTQFGGFIAPLIFTTLGIITIKDSIKFIKEIKNDLNISKYIKKVECFLEQEEMDKDIEINKMTINENIEFKQKEKQNNCINYENDIKVKKLIYKSKKNSI